MITFINDVTDEAERDKKIWEDGFVNEKKAENMAKFPEGQMSRLMADRVSICHSSCVGIIAVIDRHSLLARPVCGRNSVPDERLPQIRICPVRR